MNADLSVIMPVRDAGEYVEEAARSVVDGADGLLELVVVDDGSVDGSGDIAAACGDPVRVVRTEPAGVAAARNRGLREARGELIGFLDADDLWIASSADPRRVALEADAGLDAAVARLQPMATTPAGEWRDVLEPLSYGVMSSGIFRRAVFDRVGGFDPSLDRAEDLDWYMRARHAGVRIRVLDDLVVRYRLRPGSLTRDRAANSRDTLASLRRAIQRHKSVAP